MLSLTAAVLAVGTLIYTLWVRESDGLHGESVSPAGHLQDRKQSLYESLRELDFEYQLGKLSEADYRQTRQDLQRELAAVNAEIQRLVADPARQRASTEASPVSAKPVPAGVACPHCGARFSQPLKHCGECGKPMSREEP